LSRTAACLGTETSLCPTWRRGVYDISGHCYYVSYSYRQTWFGARQACTALDGDLATIYSEQIRTSLKQYLTDSKYWVGLIGRVWYWENGKSIRPSL